MEKKRRNKIKVICVVTRIAMDSAGKQAILIADNLDPEQYETLLVTGSCEKNEVDMSQWLEEHPRLRHIRIPEMKREIRLHLDFIAFLKLWWLFVRERPHIVHTRTAKAGCLGRLAALFARVPIRIHTFDGHVFSGYFSKAKTAFIINVERFLARITHRIIAISNKQRDELMYYLRIKNPDKIKVVPIGLDFNEFKPPVDKFAFKREIGLSEDDLVVAYVGRLAPIKRLDRLLSACVKVAERIPKARFVIVGDGELKHECEEFVRFMNLENKFRFVGVRNDIEKIYPGVDILALSSDNEGTPAVLMESLYYGTPVVCTNVGGVPDVVTHNVCGLLTEANGAAELADSIVQMLENEEMRKQFAQNGKEEVRRKFSLERLLVNLDELYKFELARKRPRLLASLQTARLNN